MMALPHTTKMRKMLSTSAITKINLVRMLRGNSLQLHLAKVHEMGLGKQFKGLQERQIRKYLMSSRS
jgi:hypothetical protein